MRLTKIIVVGLVATLLIGVVAYAASPAEIYSNLTGVSEEDAYSLRVEGKTFGELAEENGVFEEFKAQMLEEKINIIEQRVEDGLMTREEADEFIAALEENSLTCDPSNPSRLGQGFGGLGRGQGCGGNGTGRGRGFGGQGRGYGQGMGSSQGRGFWN